MKCKKTNNLNSALYMEQTSLTVSATGKTHTGPYQITTFGSKDSKIHVLNKCIPGAAPIIYLMLGGQSLSLHRQRVVTGYLFQCGLESTTDK